MKRFLALAVVLVMSAGISSGQAAASPVVKHFPLDSLEGMRATTGVSFDPKISADGKGSLRVDANQQMTVPCVQSPTKRLRNSRTPSRSLPVVSRPHGNRVSLCFSRQSANPQCSC